MESTARLHPLLSAAAVSVIVLSVAGVAAVTGILPASVGSTRDAGTVAGASLVAAPSAITPAPVALPSPVPAPAAKPRPVKQVAQQAPATEPLPQAPLVLTQAPQAPQAQPAPQPPAARPICFDCGTIEAVREIEEKGQGSWIGPVAGGVGGAILGKQMGKGNGNTIMTILGAAGGAYAGHEIEKRVRSTKRWEVSVRLEDGSMRTVAYDTAPGWHTGERVRLVNGAIVAEQRVQS